MKNGRDFLACLTILIGVNAWKGKNTLILHLKLMNVRFETLLCYKKES